ncbi:MAG: electron transport complex subunit RsxC [Phycisphaerae bacterium]|nr:electron transport complex subunit RsxC [Phycisphaerae bacterium]
MSTLTKSSGPGTFGRGVHPPYRKAMAADLAIEVLPPPSQVLIPLLQHLGAPCEAAVAAKQEVALGDVVGEAKAFVSAPVHATVAGTVGMAAMTTLPNGRHVRAIPIKAAEQQLRGPALWEELFGGDWPKSGLDRQDPKQIVEAVRAAGVVGMGGAGFPTHVKLARNEKRPVDTLLVNGCECEPYLTADYRLMLQAPGPIISGALLAAAAAGAGRIVLAVEDNKPLAIDTMRRAANGSGIEIISVRTKYPQGGERQVVPAVLGREVPTGGLPLDVGVVVLNVATATAVARAVLHGKPLTHRVVTVSGEGVVHPKNLLVPIGVTYGELIAHCGGLTDEAVRVVAGGPMMGFAVGDMDTPVTKGTSGVTVLTADDVRRTHETACVHCGRCVDVCPLNLVPTRIALAVRGGNLELAQRYYVEACCECGCCGYVCPAGIPLVQLIRQGKAQAAGK